MKNTTALLASALLGVIGYVCAPLASADPAAGWVADWKFDVVTNCGGGVPGSEIKVHAERGDSGRWSEGALPCDIVWPGTVDGWLLGTGESGPPYTTVTLTITVNGEPCGSTTVRKQAPGAPATLPPDFELAWASLSCGGVAVAFFGPYQ